MRAAATSTWTLPATCVNPPEARPSRDASTTNLVCGSSPWPEQPTVRWKDIPESIGGVKQIPEGAVFAGYGILRFVRSLSILRFQVFLVDRKLEAVVPSVAGAA